MCVNAVELIEIYILGLEADLIFSSKEITCKLASLQHLASCIGAIGSIGAPKLKGILLHSTSESDCGRAQEAKVNSGLEKLIIIYSFLHIWEILVKS